MEIDEKRWPPRVVSGAIQRFKDRGLTPDKLPEEDAQALCDGRGLEIYQAYQDRLEALNACDFGDLLLLCLELLNNNPTIA